MPAPTKYCIDCKHVKIPSDDEIKEVFKGLKRSQRMSYISKPLCAHQDNLDKITKELRSCEIARSEVGECGKNASKYESRDA